MDYIRKLKSIFLQKSVDTNETTALFIAAEKGHVDLMQILLLQGADVNVGRTNDGFTPLHIASQNNHLSVVKRLLDAPGINVDAESTCGMTSLFLAGKEGHVLVARALIDVGGADVSAAPKTTGLTPLHVAAQNNRTSVVGLLVVKSYGIPLEGRDSDGSTALYRAAENGHLTIVHNLLYKDADVNAVSNNGATPLHVAAQNNHWEVVEELTSTRGIRINAKDCNGCTPLYVAAEAGHVEIVRLLKYRGADPYAARSYGRTPLRIARLRRVQNIFRLHERRNNYRKIIGILDPPLESRLTYRDMMPQTYFSCANRPINLINQPGPLQQNSTCKKERHNEEASSDSTTTRTAIGDWTNMVTMIADTWMNVVAGATQRDGDDPSSGKVTASTADGNQSVCVPPYHGEDTGTALLRPEDNSLSAHSRESTCQSAHVDHSWAHHCVVSSSSPSHVSSSYDGGGGSGGGGFSSSCDGGGGGGGE